MENIRPLKISEVKPTSSKKKRCMLKGGKKKLRLTDMPCKCKKRYCQLHRLPECHNCSWNPKSENEMKIYQMKAGLNESAAFKKIEAI